MNILDLRHYREFKIALTILGQWPSQSPRQRYWTRFAVLVAVIGIFTPKLIRFIEAIVDVDVDLIIECIPMIIFHSVSLTKYFNWIFNEKKVNNLLRLIESDGKTLTSNQDISIMTRWVERIRKISLSYTTAMFSVTSMYLATPMVPIIMDIVFPLNHTRDKIYVYQTEYFVDGDKYYFYTLVHAYLTVPVSLALIVYFDNMLATTIAHACGMFDIVSTYLGQVGEQKVLRNDDDNIKELRKNMVRCVTLHKNALRFSRELESSVATVWLIVLFYNLSILTLTGVVTTMKLDDPHEAFKFATFTTGSVFHLFYSSFQGEQLIQQSEKVFQAAYMSQWYNTPPRFQKLLIPIMMKSMTPCTVTAGKKFVLCMDTFSSVLQKSMSFFTVLSSTR